MFLILANCDTCTYAARERIQYRSSEPLFQYLYDKFFFFQCLPERENKSSIASVVHGRCNYKLL